MQRPRRSCLGRRQPPPTSHYHPPLLSAWKNDKVTKSEPAAWLQTLTDRYGVAPDSDSMATESTKSESDTLVVGGASFETIKFVYDRDEIVPLAACGRSYLSYLYLGVCSSGKQVRSPEQSIVCSPS